MQLGPSPLEFPLPTHVSFATSVVRHQAVRCATRALQQSPCAPRNHPGVPCWWHWWPSSFGCVLILWYRPAIQRTTKWKLWGLLLQLLRAWTRKFYIVSLQCCRQYDQCISMHIKCHFFKISTMILIQLEYHNIRLIYMVISAPALLGPKIYGFSHQQD